MSPFLPDQRLAPVFQASLAVVFDGGCSEAFVSFASRGPPFDIPEIED